MRKFKQMNKKQKIFTLILGSIVLCSGGVMAAWAIITLTGSATYQIDSSGKGFVLSSDFSGAVVNVTSGAVMVGDEFEFENLNGLTPTNLTYTITDNFINVNCTDSSGDYNLSLGYSNGGASPIPITNGKLFNVSSGTGKISANISISQSSCPNNLDLDITVTPLIS